MRSLKVNFPSLQSLWTHAASRSLRNRLTTVSTAESKSKLVFKLINIEYIYIYIYIKRSRIPSVAPSVRASKSTREGRRNSTKRSATTWSHGSKEGSKGRKLGEKRYESPRRDRLCISGRSTTSGQTPLRPSTSTFFVQLLPQTSSIWRLMWRGRNSVKSTTTKAEDWMNMDENWMSSAFDLWLVATKKYSFQ